MRYVTVCENLGPRKVPGADHDKKYDAYAMLPGLAWRIDDEIREHSVVEIKEASKAKYAWVMRWIDGRTVAVFTGPDGKEYAQPVTEDPRAKDKRLGSIRKLRKPRREAPGVAPEARAIETASEVEQEEASEPVPAPRNALRRRKRPLHWEPL